MDETKPNRRIPRDPGGIAHLALAAFGAIAAAVTLIAVIESYSNLYAFAHAYGLDGWRAAIAPGAVDSFVILGELLLFAAFMLAWEAKWPYAVGFAMAAWGFLLSVGGNVWHAPVAAPVDRAVAAIWPVTAAAGLAGSLIIIKRITSGRDAGTDSGPAVSARESSPAQARREPEAGPDRIAARAGGLATAPSGRYARIAAENARIALELATSGERLPTNGALTRDRHMSPPRARTILDLARAQMNGGSDGRGPG